MKSKRQRLAAVLAIVLAAIVIAPACRADGPYHSLKEIAVGGDGGWDYLSIDAAARRLYVSHATVVVVIDIDKDAVVGQIEDTPGVHGFAIAPDLGLGFSSNGKENKVNIVDLKTLKTTAKVDTGENPDAIVYESGNQEVYAFNGHSQSVTVFQARTGKMVPTVPVPLLTNVTAADPASVHETTAGKVVATIPLPGKPEFAAVDAAAGRVYCNIEDKSEVVAIDTKTHQVVNTWPIAPGEEASGLAIDTANHRLFIGCHNQMMLMMDSTNGKVITSVPIGQGVDATAFEPGTQLAFSSCGEGTVTIAHEETPDKLTAVQTLATEHGARTMALDPVTHKIYLASAKFEAAPEPSPGGAPKQRPKIIAGSFKILVYGTDK